MSARDKLKNRVYIKTALIIIIIIMYFYTSIISKSIEYIKT